MAKWTKCAWKMPDNDRDVLFEFDDKSMIVGAYHKDLNAIYIHGEFYYNFDLIKCWSELPPKSNF